MEEPMEAVVIREFGLWYGKNRNAIPPGTVLVAKSGGYWGFREGSHLLIEPDTFDGLLKAGFVKLRDMSQFISLGGAL